MTVTDKTLAEQIRALKILPVANTYHSTWNTAIERAALTQIGGAA